MKLFKKKKEKENICEAVPYIYDFVRKSKKSKGYRDALKGVAKKLRIFQESRGIILYSNSMTYGMAEDYNSFLEDRGYLLNTIGGNLRRTFYCFTNMERDGYLVDHGYKRFHYKSEPTCTVAISSDEIRRIYQLSLKNSIGIIRDLFVVGCLTGMRYSDFSDLSGSNIRSNSIVKKTKKTNTDVEIPMHPIVREIIKRYDGFPPYRDSQANFNCVVKTLCKKAGITDKVFIERTRGGRIERLSLPRYKMISSHTARRSFATNAYLAGIPVARIMLMTGHKTEEAFFLYIRIGKSENAKELSEHPFFK